MVMAATARAPQPMLRGPGGAAAPSLPSLSRWQRATAAGAAARRIRPPAAAAGAAAASPSPPPAALALTPPPILPTRGATADPAVRPPLLVGRRLPIHPLDAAATALAAEGNRAFALPMATAIDRHPPWVALLCAAAAGVAALGVSLPSAVSAALSLDPTAAVPAWARQAVTLATETGGAAELPWLGALAIALAPPLAVWAVVRCWWFGSSDACFLLQRQPQSGEISSKEGAAGLRLLLAWALSAARFVMLSRAADACGAALAGVGAGTATAGPLAAVAAALLAALALAPSAAAALDFVVNNTDGSSKDDDTTTTTTAPAPSRAPAAAVLAVEVSWLALRCAQAAFSPLAPPLALSAALGVALTASLLAVHAQSVRSRVEAARAKRGDAVRIHLTARLAWDGFGAGAAFDGTGRKGLGRDLDDPDQPSVPIVVQLPGGEVSGGEQVEGGGEQAAAGSAAAATTAAGRVLLLEDEAARLAANEPPTTPAGRLAPFGPALARALEGVLPGERLVVRARIAGPLEEREAGGKSGGASTAADPATAPVRYFHPGLEALLTMTEARLLVYGRDLAREDPGIEPGDGLMLPIGGDGSGPRGAFQGLDGEIGATGRVPGVVLEVGRAGVRASGNAVLAGRQVELEARVETVLRRDDGEGEGEGEKGGKARRRRPTLLL